MLRILYNKYYNIYLVIKDMKLILVAVVAVLYATGTGLSFYPVYGHASPVTYDPAPNTVLDSSRLLPDQVTITFTERPELRASSIKVLNSNNERIDSYDLKTTDSDKTLSASIDKSKIIPGIYTVDWTVLSKDDGHITKGSYVFTVDDKGTAQTQNQQGNLTTNGSIGYTGNYTTSDNIVLNMNIIPYKVGQNNFTIEIEHRNGTAVENIRNVFLEFNNPEKNLGPLAETMEKIETGEFFKSGGFISQEGNWQIKVTVQRIGDYDINQTFDVSIKS
jgi:methionine-rich copper-binding protein CopC